MQWLAAVCVRRPVFTWVLMLTLVVVGAASMVGLGVDRFPNVDFPVVVVTTVLPGASPEQMETEVSDKLEEAINTISGLDELRSVSYEGLSVVIARFDLDKDTAVAAQEVRDRVNRILSQLPRDIQQPRVERMDPDAAPIMLVALSGPRSIRELTEFASRRIRRQIESLNGVGGVTILGGRARQINVDVEPARLQSYGLTVLDVQRALLTQNLEVPGGNIHQGDRTYQLRIQGRVASVEELNDLVIATRGGATIRLRDVGQATDSEAEPTSLATVNGQDVVIIAVRKQSGTNTVAVIDGLRRRIAEIQRDLPHGYQLRIVRDESEFIRNAIHAVEEHLILGSLFAALVVLLFLWNGRSTLIAALAIPTSIVSTFALIKALGLTLNTVTLLGLTLAVGIVIDDAIVVLENIVKYVEEKGYEPRRAAIVATQEIGLAVLATTLSLVAVFLPVAFMGAIVGRFMKSFGLTMSFSIMVSLFVSFTLTPMLCARWLKPSGKVYPKNDSNQQAPPKSQDTDWTEWIDPPPGPRAEERALFRAWRKGERMLGPEWTGAHQARGLYGLIEQGYMKLLALVMEHRWAVGISIVLTLASTIPLGKAVAKNFLPLDDESRFEIVLRAPEGTSVQQTQVIADRIARATRELPGVAYTVVTAGSAPGDPSGRGPNQATIFVALVPPTERRFNQQELMGLVRTRVLPRFQRDNLRVMVSAVNPMGGSGADAATIQYVLKGLDLRKLADYSQRLLQQVRQIPGVVDADISLVMGRPEYSVHIDRARAADLGVSVADIANALRLLVGDVQVGTYNEGGEQYEIHLRAGERFRSDPTLLEQVTVPTMIPGRSVRLSDVVTIRETTGPAAIHRLGRQRQVTIYTNVTPGTSEMAVIQAIEAARQQINMEPGYRSELTGRSKEMGRAFQSFLVAFVLSVVFMYLVLAAQFESWIHPITILISLPLTIPFALLSLIMLGQSMNIFSTLGILVLFGIVKKNSILQVDHMRALRRQGLHRADAVMIGNRDRLRPILMTTVAFVAGMIPLVLSSGAGSGTNRAMGSVIIGGQTLALLLTLLATPVVFTWFDDLAHSRTVARMKNILTAPFRLAERLFPTGGHNTHTRPETNPQPPTPTIHNAAE